MCIFISTKFHSGNSLQLVIVYHEAVQFHIIDEEIMSDISFMFSPFLLPMFLSRTVIFIAEKGKLVKG